MFTKAPPLSLYVHLPWCVRKCPYCDFNSHKAPDHLPENAYVQALISELDWFLPYIKDRKLVSIFFGGGTPSLFSSQAISTIIEAAKSRIEFDPEIEITLEANPGTYDEHRFAGFYDASVNRLSIGAQSFQDDKLKTLGRIHDHAHIFSAIIAAKKAGFTNFNIDLMFGLPNQNVHDALFDLQQAIEAQPTHLSWYQLTLEPNTLFYVEPPALPCEDLIWEMQIQGQALLQQHHYQQYEVSAYAQQNFICQHNYNYWTFGDYLGIGAGAHSKLTDVKSNEILRFAQCKHPKDYLNEHKRLNITLQRIDAANIIFEFMLNALRLQNGISAQLFCERTGFSIEKIKPFLLHAIERKLIHDHPQKICPTALGKQFLNDLVQIFLP